MSKAIFTRRLNMEVLQLFYMAVLYLAIWHVAFCEDIIDL